MILKVKESTRSTQNNIKQKKLRQFTPPLEYDTLEKVTPFKYGHVWYLCQIWV